MKEVEKKVVLILLGIVLIILGSIFLVGFISSLREGGNLIKLLVGLITLLIGIFIFRSGKRMN